MNTHLELSKLSVKNISFGLLRIAPGWIFFWAFVDKLLGLGFSTEPGKGWIDGVSPTIGYLKFGSYGPFASLFQTIAGNVIVDWLYMMGLLLVGLSLILGMGVKIAGYSGAALVLLIWLTALPPEHNPLIDEHIVYSFVLLSFTQLPIGHVLGVGKWWSQTSLVKRYPILQ